MHLIRRQIQKTCFLIFISGFLAAAAPPAFSQSDNPSYGEGLERMSHHDFEGAIQSFNSCVGSNAKFGQAYFKRGQCFYYLQEYKMAIDDFGEAIGCDPKKSDYYLWRGATISKVGDDNPRAIMDYEQALRLDPDLLKAAKIGAAQNENSSNGDSKTPAATESKTVTNPKSVENYKEALRIVSNNIVATFVDGTIFRGIVRPEHPEDKQAAFLCPVDIDKIVSDPKAVFDSVRQQLDRSPTDANLHFRCALALQQMGKTQRAIDEYGDAISQLPSSSQFFLARAICHHNNGDDVSAQNDLDRARVIDPAVPASLKLPSRSVPGK